MIEFLSSIRTIDIILHNRLIFLNRGILPFFLFCSLFIIVRFLVNDVTQQGHIAIVMFWYFPFSMHPFWSAIPFYILYELPCLYWFPLVGFLLVKCLYRLFLFCHVIIFMIFRNCFYNLCTSDSHSFRFLNIFNR